MSGAAVEVHISGVVQGVGMRPTICRIAAQEQLVGEVRNHGAGVLIRASGSMPAIERLLARVQAEAPPLARIDQILTQTLARPLAHDRFVIAASEANEAAHATATADAAMCAACREELLNPDARRHGYAFTSCSDCGPRFSIMRTLPYDRDNTTMARFVTCPACRAEYEQPRDRRFHAQPIACPRCGPRLWLEALDDGRAAKVFDASQAIAIAAAALRAGKVVALRGVGGFHIACDARDPAAILRLRARKHREAKPLAIMVGDVEAARRHCSVDELERALLESVAAPIVLLRHDGRERLPKALAPGLDTLGVMLAYTPLHLLLLRAFAGPLVMTSANRHGAPMITTLSEARTQLRGVAELALMHDREIANRVDDAVVHVAAGEPRVLRRGRGHAPTALRLPDGFADAPPCLAFGADQHAAFCLLDAGTASLSAYQGELSALLARTAYLDQLERSTELLDHRPALLACDRHREYASTRLARERAASEQLPLVQVQHHHAHIAACMAEHGLPIDTPPVLGLALDGLGYGDDGTLWGGELLLADYRQARRLGALVSVAMPGGVQAIHEPWRNLYAHLRRLGWAQLLAEFATLEPIADLQRRAVSTLDRMIDVGIASPLASSTGRLFDAVAAALGICRERVAYPAQAAMLLEAAAASAGAIEPAHAYPFARVHTQDLWRLDPAPMWWALLRDLAAGLDVGVIAARFEAGLARALARLLAQLHAELPGQSEQVMLSGGCMQNRALLEQLTGELELCGLRACSPIEVPANDGGLALGQAVVAAASHLHAEQWGDR